MIRIDAIWLATEPMDMAPAPKLRWPEWSQCLVRRSRTALTCSPTAEAVLAQRVVHADELPYRCWRQARRKRIAPMSGLTAPPCSALKAEVYDFSSSRAGEHARNFLGTWNGKLVCDDFAGYKASFELGITEINCMAHACR